MNVWIYYAERKGKNRELIELIGLGTSHLGLLLVCVSFTIIGDNWKVILVTKKDKLMWFIRVECKDDVYWVIHVGGRWNTA